MTQQPADKIDKFLDAIVKEKALEAVVKRKAIDEVAAAYPTLWAQCYPKIYQEVRGNYVSMRDIASILIGTAVRVEHGFLGANEKIELVWSSKLVAKRVPTYWLSEDMAEALKLTTPPNSFDLETFRFPFDAAIFMLPQGVIQHAQEGSCTFLSYVHTRPKESIKSLARTDPQFYDVMDNGATALFAGTMRENLLHWTFPNAERIDLANLDYWVREFEKAEYQHRSAAPQLFGGALNPDDQAFMARAAHLLFGTLILMTSQPHLVTDGILRRRIAKRDMPVREFWTPTTIGENYKLRRVPVPPQGGTHASPRFHWVRGFHREQSYGEKHSLRKLIWVEPYARGIDDAQL